MASHEEARLIALDGLRAVAVAIVVASHNLVVGFELGGYGVRLFFVLSGFLITGILLRARDEATRVRQPLWRVCGAFYARRALRIFPLAYAALAVAWIIGLSAMRGDWAWYVTYSQNVLMALRGSYDGGLGHFWSLAVEEQFYLFWPFVVLWCPRRVMLPLFMFLIVFSGAVRWLLVWHDQALPAYVLMPSRLDALTAGAVLALLAHEERSVSAPALLGSGLTLLSTMWMSMVSAVTFEWGWILVSAAAVVWLSEAREGATSRLLSTRTMVYLGTISYGIYVWHRVIPEIVVWFEERYNVWSRFPHEPGWTRLAVVGLSAVLVSVCSWHFFERPVNDLKRRFPYVSRGANREPTNVG